MYIQTELDLTNLDGIKEKINSVNDETILENKLITNGEEGNFLTEIKEAFTECKRFYLSIAFINFSGLQLILDNLKTLEQNSVKGQIITSTYLNFTQPAALSKLREFKNIDLKVFITEKTLRGFHTKAYIFEYEDNYKIYIGSSNLTQAALKSNEEWNIKIVCKKDSDIAHEVLEAFGKLYNESNEVDDDFLAMYSEFLKSIEVSKVQSMNSKFLENAKKIIPNSMQEKALINLKRLRYHGEKKALVIAATGTGKTYMSAFDVKEVMPKKLLFVVHREDILRKAMNDYQKIIKDKSFGIFTGNEKDFEADYIFATIQSISRYYDKFKENEFDYIVMDEAHHSSSDTYHRILNYFKPSFLLGMTATPERSEGTDIFSIYDNNIALEIRLSDALEKELIIPFHYFGITDIDLVDYTGINLNDVDKIAKILQINERVDFIIEKMNFYGFDGVKRKCIGFCANIEHASYMAEKFNNNGIESAVLTGKDSIDKRREIIKRLEDNGDKLEVIFTVDIFNEGVDIPPINTVLMLRPTQSSIIFVQQLGRGLRKHYEKEFLTVLDFIGNYNKAFLIPIALNGGRYYDKESLKVSIKTDFANILGCTNIQMDEIVKEQILEQIDGENFNTLKYLKEEYNEFKKLFGGKAIIHLSDFLVYDTSPNPIKFAKAVPSKNYLGFLDKVEKNQTVSELLENIMFKNILKDFTAKLPLKRPFEFIILRYLIKNNEGTKVELKNEIEKYIEFIDDDTLEYTIACLRGDYYHKRESSYNFIIDTGSTISLASEIKEIISEEKFKIFIEDCINYGLITYEREFGFENYGIPFLKLYSQYTRDEVVRVSNAKMKFGGYGMGGLKTNGNEWFMFVNLEKEEGIKESINHENMFLDKDIFVWQSRNTTTIESDAGQKLINNVKEGINMHLFIRKYKEIDGSVEPYIYVGKTDTIYHEGEKPITVHLKLRNKLPMKIYNEFTK